MRRVGVALLLLSCAPEEPPAVPAAPPPARGEAAAPPTPAPAPEPQPDAAASPPPSASAAPSAEPAPPVGPAADNPGYADVASLSGPHLPDGHYFVDGSVGTPLPCKPCPKPPACKPGGKCPPYPACADCSPSLVLEHAGASISVALSDAAPPFRAGERVRIVLEKQKSTLLFGTRKKPCPPSRCLETEPPTLLEPAAKGKSVRRDGERCYARQGCPPNAKCDMAAESRVRCP